MKNNLLFGLLVGLASACWSLMMFLAGWDDSPFLRNFGFFTIVFLALGIYLGILRKRNIEEDGGLIYTDALRTGMFIALVAGAVTGIYSYFYVLTLKPGIAETVIREKTELLMHFGASPEKIARHSGWIRREYSPLGQLILNGGGFFILGTVFAALFAIFLSVKKEELDEQEAEPEHSES